MREPPGHLLLFGATGFVGAHLLRWLESVVSRVTAVRRSSPPPAGRCRWMGWPTTPDRLDHLLRKVSPDCIVNAAAAGSIAECEADPETAREVNAILPSVLARAAARTGARFIHLSTDQVFDGREPPYAEDRPPSPISVYGHTKAAADRLVLDSGADAVVLRLNLVYGKSLGARLSSSDTLLAEARAKGAVPLFTDERRTPVAVTDVARAVQELLTNGFRGILHLGGPESLSRYELGRAILEAAGLARAARPVSLAEYPGLPRAPDTSFDTALARRVLTRAPAPLRERLSICV